MARNDPYIPDYADNIAAGSDVSFSGSTSTTSTAIINELYADQSAFIYIDGSNDGGTTWQTLTQLTDANGNTTFSGDWHTQFNRLYVSEGVRRVRINNQGSGDMHLGVTGDER